MKTALITGANKSIGFETARQLIEKGYFVYVGSRDRQKGEEASARLGNHAEAIRLDVTDMASIAEAREVIGRKTPVLDALINNAGISGGFPQNPKTTPLSKIRE